MITVLVADDHGLVRHGIRRIVESHGQFEVVAEADSGLAAVEQGRLHQPALAILDVGMKDLSGLAALARLRECSPATRSIIVTMHADERYVRRAVKEGACGYVLKESVEEDLIDALIVVHAGGKYFSPAVRPASELLAWVTTALDDPYESLTSRERELYHLLAGGSSNKDIANLFDLSLHTVETHRARIMQKLGLHSVAELVISAVRRGLVA